MTITSTLSRMPAQAGDGVTTAFAYTFKIYDEDDLLVIVKDADGVETTQVKGAHYSVTGVENDAGGNVIFVSAPVAGVEVHLILNPEFTQLNNYQAEEYEKAFDKQTQQNQRAKDIAERSLRVSEAAGVNASDLTVTPVANATLTFDADKKIVAKALAELGNIAAVTSPLVLAENTLSIDVSLAKNKYDATVAPTVNDDETTGYSIGSVWTGSVLADVYICIDASEGAAVWRLFSGALAALDSVGGAHIDDNAIDLDQLAHATSGDIIYYGASGVPLRLAKGLDGQILTLSSGLPSWQEPNVPSEFTLTAAAKFDGTGAVEIVNGFNFSSITDLGAGDYQLNFSTPMDTADYMVMLMSKYEGNPEAIRMVYQTTVNYVRVRTGYSYSGGMSLYDHSRVYVCIFGGKL